MRLQQLNKKELQKLANKADVVLGGDESNKEIVTKLEENGVNYEFYKKTVLDSIEEEDSLPLFSEKPVLLKMERKNPSFEAFGCRFTRDHPYVLLDELTAQQIIDNYDGFRIASPKEAKAFYN